MHDCSEDSNRPRKCAAEARYFAHCGERPKGVALWTPTTFEKVDKTFRFKNFLLNGLFRQTEASDNSEAFLIVLLFFKSTTLLVFKT